MNFIEQEIVVQGAAEDGPGAGVRISGEIFRQIERTVRPCVSMALTGRSAPSGKPPTWLQTACNVRAIGFSRRGTDLVFSLSSPALGDAAPKVFEQASLWDEHINPQATALELMGKLVNDVRAQQVNSDTFDEPMLTRLADWERLFEKRLASVVLPGLTMTSVLDKSVVAGAKALNSRIPAPRQVRVVGTVDMVRHSTRSLGLRLANGDEVRCVVVDDGTTNLGELLTHEVTVLGKAIYRPSSTVLRLDVEAILSTVQGRDQFSTLPPAFDQVSTSDRRPQTSRNGVATIFGTWPGDETDADLMAVLAELRG